MKRLSGLVLGCAFGGLVTAGTAMAQECRGPVTEKEALAAEDARYAAQTANDFAAMERLFGTDLVYVHSSAAVDNKATFIETMRSGATKYVAMKRSDVTVRAYGCTAIITGRADFVVRTQGKENPVPLRFHTVWIKRDNGLQFVSWQSTRVPPPQ